MVSLWLGFLCLLEWLRYSCALWWQWGKVSKNVHIETEQQLNCVLYKWICCMVYPIVIVPAFGNNMVNFIHCSIFVNSSRDCEQVHTWIAVLKQISWLITFNDSGRSWINFNQYFDLSMTSFGHLNTSGLIVWLIKFR